MNIEIYSLFQQNFFQNISYIIHLNDGTQLEGVPLAGNGISIHNPDATFTLTDKDGKVIRVKFRDVKKAKRV